MLKIEEILNKIFGDKNAKVKTRLLGGMMNETYIVTANNRDYVLYLPQGNANDVVDREEEKFVQKIASDLNIASKNIYCDTTKGIKCHEYIEGESLNKISDFDYEKIAIILKKFHSSPIKSNYNYDPFTKLDGYIKSVESFTKLSKDYEDLLDILNKNKQYLMKQEMTLCHNDFQRSNIVKSTDNNYYIIDFEFVANNDPIYDIACFGNNIVEEGRKLLDAYFDHSPSDEQIKRYYLWRTFISVQWSLMALIKDHNGEGKIHGINFLEVSSFFVENAKIARGNL